MSSQYPAARKPAVLFPNGNAPWRLLCASCRPRSPHKRPAIGQTDGNATAGHRLGRTTRRKALAPRPNGGGPNAQSAHAHKRPRLPGAWLAPRRLRPDQRHGGALRWPLICTNATHTKSCFAKESIRGKPSVLSASGAGGHNTQDASRRATRGLRDKAPKELGRHNATRPAPGQRGGAHPSVRAQSCPRWSSSQLQSVSSLPPVPARPRRARAANAAPFT